MGFIMRVHKVLIFILAFRFASSQNGRGRTLGSQNEFYYYDDFLSKDEIIELIEAKNRMIEAKTKEIEAKCLSKAEIKELITDECSKNTCQNAKRPSKDYYDYNPLNLGRPRTNGRSGQK